MIFKNVNGSAVATSATGLMVKAHATGLQVGTENKTPLTMKNPRVKILTSLQEYDVNGAETDSFYHSPSFTVNCSASELPNSDIFSEEVREFYVAKLVEMTTPKEDIVVVEENEEE